MREICTSCKFWHTFEDKVHFQWKSGVITELGVFFNWFWYLLPFIAHASLKFLIDALSQYVHASDIPYCIIIFTQKQIIAFCFVVVIACLFSEK